LAALLSVPPADASYVLGEQSARRSRSARPEVPSVAPPTCLPFGTLGRPLGTAQRARFQFPWYRVASHVTTRHAVSRRQRATLVQARAGVSGCGGTRMRLTRVCAAVALVVVWTAGLRAGTFTNFETGHVRPLAISPGGDWLFAVNTPDARLTVYALTAAG